MLTLIIIANIYLQHAIYIHTHINTYTHTHTHKRTPARTKQQNVR